MGAQQQQERAGLPAIHSGGAVSALVPQSIPEAVSYAELIAETEIAGKLRGKPKEVFATIARGMEVGLSPFQSMANIALINGRPSLWGDAIPALVYGQNKGHQIIETTNAEPEEGAPPPESEWWFRCRCVRGDNGAEIVASFTQADAVRAGLWKKQGPWQQYPKRMLKLRARAWACRDAFPDVLMGLSVAEEARDIEPNSIRDVTPQPSAAAVARGQAGSQRAIPSSAPVTVEEEEPNQEAEVVEDLSIETEVLSAENADLSTDTPANEPEVSAQVEWFIVRGEQEEVVSESRFAEQLIAWYSNPKITHEQAERIQQAHADQVKMHPQRNEILEAFIAVSGDSQ